MELLKVAETYKEEVQRIKKENQEVAKVLKQWVKANLPGKYSVTSGKAGIMLKKTDTVFDDQSTWIPNSLRKVVADIMGWDVKNTDNISRGVVNGYQMVLKKETWQEVMNSKYKYEG